MSKSFLVAVKEETDDAKFIKGIPVHYCGVGKINAAIGAHELIQRGVTEIINIGSCGSLHHEMGAIFKIGSVIQDIDATPISEYGKTPFEEGPHVIVLDDNSPSSCFTTDYFYDHAQKEKYSPAYLDQIASCSLFDMELYAIAKVCLRNKVKCSAFKWVSDDGNFDHWQENCRLSLDKFIHHFNS